MSNATVLLARRSIRARIGRLIAIAIAIIIGVSFVVGSFVLADSLRSGFDTLFTEINSHTDLEVRAKLAFGEGTSDNGTPTRDPIPADLVATIESVDGVARVDPFIQRQAVLVKTDGTAFDTGGAPSLGISWDGDTDNSSVKIRDGAAPSGDEVALDKASAEKNDYGVGDEVTVVTSTGPHTFMISGLIGVGDTDGFGGASVVLFDPATAAEVFDAKGEYDAIDLAVTDGADAGDVQAALEQALPDDVEVITQETLNKEAKDSINSFVGPFSTGLLIFAFITAFVSAFLINNVFAITIGQRLRELALLRAIGGGGPQVRRLIIVEALIMSIVATIVGIAGGVGVAKLLLGIFNAAGAGFPDMPIVLKPLAVIMAFLVGVGITLAAVTIPARRAAKIPPVAAMRPELGFDSLSSKRLVAGAITVVVGAAMFVVGLFVKPGGTLGLIVFAGGGALLLFLGAASVASTVAKPVTRLIGWPVAKIYNAPGQLARDNAGRAPKRTSATAAALMIGVALVSASSVFAASLRDSFERVIDRGVSADFVVQPTGFGTIPGQVADELGELPELAAVSGVRFVDAQLTVDGAAPETKSFSVANPTSIGELMNLGMVEGTETDLANGILVNKDPAGDLDLTVGEDVTLTFQNGTSVDLPVAGIFEDSALAGNWVISQDVVDANVETEPLDFLVAIKTANGVSPEAATKAIDQVLKGYPQAELKTAEQFKDDQAAQIDQLLVIITVLLAFAIVIAVLGISITLGLAVFERTREIGLMRAVGMTRRQTRRMVRWEAVIVSTFGAILGIVIGTALGAALTLAVPDSVIDGLSFSISTVLIILVGAVLAGLIAALYPSRKASNMNVLDAISSE